MEDKSRRRTDVPYLQQLSNTLVDGDISMTVLMAGFGLVLWALFGMFMFTSDLDAYTKMFPFGNGAFWATNYIVCGVAMWWLVAAQFPPLGSLLVGAWVSVIWTWSSLARMTVVATYQTGNATSIIYILIGLLIIHRSARK
jgi:hypothetical protein